MDVNIHGSSSYIQNEQVKSCTAFESEFALQDGMAVQGIQDAQQTRGFFDHTHAESGSFSDLADIIARHISSSHMRSCTQGGTIKFHLAISRPLVRPL